MDEISELEKYKDLLDSGAISEEEFIQLKQKLLGLKTDEEKEAERQAERAEALKEIDAMREAQKQKEEAKQQIQEQQVNVEQQAQEKAEPEEETKQPEQAEKAESEDQQQAQEEQIKVEPELRTQEIQGSKTEEKPAEGSVKTQLNEEQKHEDAPKAEQTQETQNSSRTAGSVIKSIILWIVCLFLIFLGIPSLMMQNTFYIIFGIIALILAALACPFITSRTKNIPALATFYQIKVPVVVVLAILAFVFMYLAGSSVL